MLKEHMDANKYGDVMSDRLNKKHGAKPGLMPESSSHESKEPAGHEAGESKYVEGAEKMGMSDPADDKGGMSGMTDEEHSILADLTPDECDRLMKSEPRSLTERVVKKILVKHQDAKQKG